MNGINSNSEQSLEIQSAQSLAEAFSLLESQVRKLVGRETSQSNKDGGPLADAAKQLGLTTIQLTDTITKTLASAKLESGLDNSISDADVKSLSAHQGKTEVPGKTLTNPTPPASGTDIGQWGQSISSALGNSGLMEAGQGIMSAASSMASLVLKIPQMIEQIMGMVTQILEAWGTIGSKIGKFLSALPQAVMDALMGLTDIFYVWLDNFSQGQFWDALIQGIIGGITGVLDTLFGGGARAQSKEQTQALQALVNSISSWIKDQNRKDWGLKDWTQEYHRLETKKQGLNKKSATYWDQYIKLGKDQFEALKKIQQTAEQSANTLKGVLGTLQSTLDQISGSQYNPQGSDMAAQTAQFSVLLKAAQATGISATERKTRVGALTQFSTKYLDNAKAQLRSSGGYQKIYNQVVGGLQGVQGLVQSDLASVQGQTGGGQLIKTAQALQNDTQAQIKTAPDGEGPFAMMIKLLQFIWKTITNVSGGIRALSSVLNGIWTVLNQMIQNIVKFGQGLWNALLSLPKAVYDMLKTLWDKLWGAVSGIGTVFFNKIKGLLDPISGFLKKIRDGIVGFPTSIKNAVKEAVKSLPNAIKDAIKGILGGAGKAGGSIIKAAGNLFSDQHLKTQITKGKDILPGVPAAQWTWNDQANKLGLFGQSFGVIAQDLEKVVPGLVHQAGRFKQVDYSGLAGLVPSLANMLPGYANGGISYGPQLAWVSEGAHAAEAHVPLPNGKSIPVELNQPVPARSGNSELARLLGEVSRKLDRLKEISQRTGTLVDVTRSKSNSSSVVVEVGALEASLSNRAAERGQRGNLQFSRG